MTDESETTLSAEHLFAEAKASIEQGQWVEALPKLDEALKLAPDFVAARVARAGVRAELGDAAGTVADLDEAARLQPDEPEHVAQRGRALYAMGQFESALEAFEQAAKLGPLAELAFDRGQCALALSRHAEAEAWFSEDLERDASSELSRWNRHLARRGQDKHDEALDDLRIALESAQSPDAIFAILDARRDVYVEKGDPQAAMEASMALVERFPEQADPLVSQSRLLLQLDRPAEAEMTLDVAIELDDGSAEAHTMRALARYEQDKHAEALADLDRAIELDPEDPTLFSHRGWVHQAMGTTKAALADYDRAIEMAPAFPDARHQRRALLLELGRTDDADKDREALEAMGETVE
ncbi:MAG: tetratricopeptide repeat protein [Myxococcota bacterium]